MATKKNWKMIWKRAKLYIILGIAVFSFAILGMIQGGSELFSGGGAAAIVNKEVISLGDFMQEVRQMESNMGSYFKDLPASQRESFTAMIRQRALQGLIQQELMYQTAIEKGVVAPSSAVRDMIVSAPILQESGQFSRLKYDQFLQQMGKSANDFEATIAKSLVINELQGAFQKSLFPADIELKNSYMAKETKLEVEYIEIIKDQLSKAWPIKDTDTVAFVSNSADKIQNYFESNKTEFTSEKKVKARHILIKGDDKNALDTAKALKKQLNEGANFEKLAKENSSDPVSAAQGGDLGFFKRGDMVPTFEDKAFSMKVGEVSEPVKSEFGYHIIKVEDIKAQSETELKDVETVIAKKLLAEQEVNLWMDSLEQSLKSESSKLETVLSKANLKWKKTGEFSLNQTTVPNLGDDERLIKAALNLKVGETANDIFKSRGKGYLIKLTKLNKPDLKIAKAELSDTIAQQKAANIMQIWFEEASKDAKIQRNQKVLSQIR